MLFGRWQFFCGAKVYGNRVEHQDGFVIFAGNDDRIMVVIDLFYGAGK